MNRNVLRTMGVTTCLLAWAAAPGWSQGADPQPIKVKLTDPTRPGLVKVMLANGSITVKGSASPEVMVEADPGQGSVQVRESDNEVTVEQPLPASPAELRLSVPAKTSLQLKTLNGGNIRVEQVEGDLEVSSVNGSVTLREAGGVVLAHSLQGKVSVQMRQVTPGKPMSFSSMNGDVEVWLPPDAKADVKLETLNGAVRSEFAVEARAGVAGRTGKNLAGKINGGGPEVRLKTLNGSVSLRKLAVRKE